MSAIRGRADLGHGRAVCRLLADCLEKVETAASAKFLQRLGCCQVWLVMLLQSAWEGRRLNPSKLRWSPHPTTPNAPAALRKLAPTSERTFSTQSALGGHF